MIRTSPPVAAALAERRPVVALESTVLAHGLPRPRNLEVGRAMEQAVADGGATPATVGVVAGVPHVGMGAAEIERLAMADGVLKLSTRDLAVPVARGTDGATTVAATMWLAARAGVQVFATGGIGGVHRGEARDISADLTELGRTPMLVVCAGAKSVLDLPATREALETAGVLVVGWGTDELPAFYSARSGIPWTCAWTMRGRRPRSGARTATWAFPARSSSASPRRRSTALDADEVEAAIAAALEGARREGIRGKDVTPYLLRAVAAATGGRSLEANVALLLNNARVAASVAVALAEAEGA